jgi:hypothetical protein
MNTEFITRTAKRLMTWEAWLYGLLSGFIGGGATAAVTATSLAVANASGVDVPVLNFKAIGVVFVSAGATSALAFLAKSPLPPVAPAEDPTTNNQQPKGNP